MVLYDLDLSCIATNADMMSTWSYGKTAKNRFLYIYSYLSVLFLLSYIRRSLSLLSERSVADRLHLMVWLGLFLFYCSGNMFSVWQFGIFLLKLCSCQNSGGIVDCISVYEKRGRIIFPQFHWDTTPVIPKVIYSQAEDSLKSCGTQSCSTRELIALWQPLLREF